NGSFMRLFKTPSPRAIYGGGRTCRKTVVFRQSAAAKRLLYQLFHDYITAARRAAFVVLFLLPL
ncbi:MAG: hypothetical protein KHW93_11950, partial [Butyricicoccus pullicaecorum]|nr:hypothetical protein [Butyricicoccus pullicaecorum]